jgi:hypothetical protein
MRWHKRLATGMTLAATLLGSAAAARAQDAPVPSVYQGPVFAGEPFIDAPADRTPEALAAYARREGVPRGIANRLAKYADSNGEAIFNVETVGFIKGLLKPDQKKESTWSNQYVQDLFDGLPPHFARELANLRLQDGSKTFRWDDIFSYNNVPCAKDFHHDKLTYAQTLAAAGLGSQDIIQGCRGNLAPEQATRYTPLLAGSGKKLTLGFIRDAQQWQVPDSLVTTMLKARPERNGACELEDIIEFKKAGGTEGYFRGMPDIFTCQERIDAFSRLMPTKYARAFAHVRKKTQDPTINGKSTLQFWMAERPKGEFHITTYDGAHSFDASMKIYELETLIREDPLGYQAKIGSPDALLRTIWDAQPNARARKPRAITKYIEAATGQTNDIGWTLTALQAYRYDQLGISVEDILPNKDSFPAGQKRVIVAYPESDHNGAIFTPNEITDAELGHPSFQKQGFATYVAVTGSAAQYCSLLRYFSGAEIVVRKHHGSPTTGTLAEDWLGPLGSAEMTTATDLRECYATTAPNALIVYDACLNGALLPDVDGVRPQNMVDRCAQDAPGRICVGARDTISWSTAHVSSWMPFQVNFTKCTDDPVHPYLCTPTDMNVTYTASRPPQ